MASPLLLRRMQGAAFDSDPYWPSVSALLHLTGADGGTIFTDEKGAAWSATGGAEISTAHGGYGSSLLLNGTTGYISAASSTAYQLGAGDFTLEATVYLTAYAANNAGQYQSSVISKDALGSREFSLNISGTSSSYTTLAFFGAADSSSGFTLVSAAHSFLLNTEYAIRACRSGSTVYLFVNGVLIGSGAFSRTIQSTSTSIKIGANMFDATYKYALPGHIWEARITKGIARSTAGYTVDITQFPNR